MEPNLNYSQGDIILIPFPYTDLSSHKKRPALIISNNNINKTQDKICLMITSVYSKNAIKIEASNCKYGKLPLVSYIKPKRIITISQEKIIKKVNSINQTFLEEIKEDFCKQF